MNKTILIRLMILLCVCMGTFDGYGQVKKRSAKRKVKNSYTAKKPDKLNEFLQTQWWLGLKTGINLTEAVPGTRYAVFSPLNYEASMLEKTYNSFEKVGMQAGIEVTLYHKGFSYSLQPNFRRQRFGYDNQYSWTNPEIADQRLELDYTQEVSLDYIEIPFFIKYDILRNAKLRPFLQVGAYYGILSGAEKMIDVSGQDHASGGVNEFQGESLHIGAESLFLSSSAGVLGGAGVNYDLWKIRVVFDVVYRYGLHNISDTENRFSNNSLSGMGDTMDDISMNNLSFNLGFLFPLRFISKNFNAIE